VAAAAHRDSETVQAGEFHRTLNVGNAGAARNQRWPSINIPVPYPSGYVVAGVTTLDQLAAKGLPEILNVCGVHRKAICIEAPGNKHRHVSTS
jgi:hypothetical protein